MLAIGKKAEVNRRLRAARQELARTAHDVRLKVERHTRLKNDAEAKVKAAEARLQRLEEETKRSVRLSEKRQQEAKRESLVAKKMTSSYSEDLRRLDAEEAELLARLEAAEKKTLEMETVMWRKNAEVRGLKDESGKRVGVGKNPRKYVFSTEGESEQRSERMIRSASSIIPTVVLTSLSLSRQS